MRITSNQGIVGCLIEKCLKLPGIGRLNPDYPAAAVRVFAQGFKPSWQFGVDGYHLPGDRCVEITDSLDALDLTKR
jgi:hypothetical protein